MDSTTLQYYETNAGQYFSTTVNADISVMRDRFLRFLPVGVTILDLGCGSGRDSKAFMELGYSVVSVDGSQSMCRLAEEYTGQKVICSDILDYLPDRQYAGIWACSSLLHLREEEVKTVLRKYQDVLTPDACFYCSFKYGQFSGYRGGRWYTDMAEAQIIKIVQSVGNYSIADMQVSSDVIPGRENQKWLNVFLMKTNTAIQ